jgi:hypothetical protein
MAQSGYTPIILLNSTTASNVPTTSNLAVGELAINIPDGKLYYNKSGTITVIATSATAALTVPITPANGGTGQTTYTNGQLLIGNTTGNTLTKATLTAGSGITITNGSGAITIASSGGSQATPTVLGTVYASTLDLSGNATTAVGYGALNANTGSSNTAFGASALYTNTTGVRNVAVGYATLYTNNGIENVAMGVQALQLNTSGAGNTAIGTYASASNTTATYNTSVGYSALQLTTTGTSIVALGTSALYSNTSGAYNVAVGRDALTYNTTASYNTAVGYQAGYSHTTGGRLVAIGSGALGSTTTGDSNVGVGYYVGYNNTTGTQNTYIGDYAAFGATGSYNTVVGGRTGYLSLTTGNNNTLIGNSSGVAAGSDSYEVVLGSGGTGKGSNTGFIAPNSGVYQGNNSAAWSVSSDQRLKKNIVDNNVGLDKVIQIQVRNFEYRTEDEITDLPKNQAIAKQGVQLGVIAQELQQILPDCVKTESTGVMSVDSTDIMYHMINAIKELNAKVIALETKLGV